MRKRLIFLVKSSRHPVYKLIAQTEARKRLLIFRLDGIDHRAAGDRYLATKLIRSENPLRCPSKEEFSNKKTVGRRDINRHIKKSADGGRDRVGSQHRSRGRPPSRRDPRWVFRVESSYLRSKIQRTEAAAARVASTKG